MKRPEGVRAARPRQEQDLLDVILDKGTLWFCYGAFALAVATVIFLIIVQVSR